MCVFLLQTKPVSDNNAEYELQRMRVTIKDVVGHKTRLEAELQAQDRQVCSLTSRCSVLEDTVMRLQTASASASARDDSTRIKQVRCNTVSF